MNIFVDNHHAELTYSLELLLSKRLGHTVFYPVGMDWYEKGYWHVYPHRDTARQYLGDQRLDTTVHGKERVFTGRGWEPVDKGLEYSFDITKEVHERGIRFDRFLEKPVDVLIASIPQHVGPFNEIIRKYKPKAKGIFQMGNMYSDFRFDGVRNVLNSTNRRVPFYIHSVRYSQEFDLARFYYSPPPCGKKIVNLSHYTTQNEYYQQTKKAVPDYAFESYGAGNETGNIARIADVAAKIREADFVWHLKSSGDGYGHVVHNAAACGRPVIISKKVYRHLRFGCFIEDGRTCVCVDGLSPGELAKKILHYGEPGRLRSMGERIYQRFRELVDFEKDAKNVQQFLEKLR